jgi:signal transduction histidine kinase
MRLVRPPRTDVVLALGVAGLAVATLLAPASSRAHVDALELVLVLVSTAPLIAWRVAPLSATMIMCAGLVAMAACGFQPAIGGLPPAFAVASAAYYGGRRAAAFAGLAFTAAAIAAIVIMVGDPAELIAPLAVALALAGMAVGIGDALRTLHARNDELEMLRAVEARQAVAQERVRIARDVHDVVGHALAGIALQARAGERLLTQDPAAVGKNLATIDALAGQALAETRASIGTIRDPDRRSEPIPAPQLSDLAELVARLQQEDLVVALALGVDPAAVPPALQTVVYRVVQEALSNVVRHARSSRAEVMINRQAGRLDVEVHDNGTARAFDDGTGHGLRGMRERVAQFGGVLLAGPRAEGGWGVRAEIPLTT